MPTIARIGPYRFYFFSDEPDEPPHVHVDRDDATLKAWLVNVELARSRGFPPKEINRILQLVDERRVVLLESWNEYFKTSD